MNPSTPDTLFGDIALFSHLRPDQLHRIEQISTIRHCDVGEILFYEGDQSLYFHFLVEGEINIFKSSSAVETISLHRFRAPSLVAEMATLKKIPYPASAECTLPATVIRIKRDPFLAFLQEDPSLSIAFIASLTQKIAVLERSLQRLSAPGAAAKVARLILEEKSIFERLKGIEIAQLLGMTPETLSRTLTKFQKQLLISTDKSRKINILDSAGLAAIANHNFPLREAVIE